MASFRAEAFSPQKSEQVPTPSGLARSFSCWSGALPQKSADTRNPGLSLSTAKDSLPGVCPDVSGQIQISPSSGDHDFPTNLVGAHLNRRLPHLPRQRLAALPVRLNHCRRHALKILQRLGWRLAPRPATRQRRYLRHAPFTFLTRGVQHKGQSVEYHVRLSLIVPA